MKINCKNDEIITLSVDYSNIDKACKELRKTIENNHDFDGMFIARREYKPKPLDNTKIDYRIKAHTASSQICEGVYPEGTSIAEVENVVKGTFGGRFEYFRDGKFKYIAYTD